MTDTAKPVADRKKKPISEEVLANLEELSNQASQGPRVRDHGIICVVKDGKLQLMMYAPQGELEKIAKDWGPRYIAPDYGQRHADARFVTALSPTLVRELIRGYREHLSTQGQPVVATGDDGAIVGTFIVHKKGRSSVELDASHADLEPGRYVLRAAQAERSDDVG